MDWITAGIAIGDYKDAEILADGISMVLCLKPGCGCVHRDDVDVLHYPMLDGPGNDKQRFLEAVSFIREAVRHDETILVHCHAGRSWSVVAVGRFLMCERNLGAREALDLLA